MPQLTSAQHDLMKKIGAVDATGAIDWVKAFAVIQALLQAILPFLVNQPQPTPPPAPVK